MSKKYLKFILNSFLAAAVFFSYLFFTSPVKAGTRSELEGQLDTAGVIGWGALATPTSLADIIQAVVSAFLGLLGIIFIVLIIYAGFNWMTARGDEEKVTKAKDTLVRAVIGLIIIIAAYSITYFVFNALPGGGSGPLIGS